MKPQLFKPKTVQLLLAITILFLIACGCTKNNPQDQLPPITQTGENTFGCIINGKVFVTKNSISTTPGNSEFRGLRMLVGHDFFNNNGDDKWSIRAGNFKDTPSTYIYMPTIINGTGEYTIQRSDLSSRSNLPYPHVYCRIYNNNESNNLLYHSIENSGEINLSRLDFGAGIYSGTFNLQLVNRDNPNDFIEIKEGRFDIDLKTINR